MARSEAQIKASEKYEAKCKKFVVRFQLEIFDKLKQKADSRGTTFHRLVLDILEDWLTNN
ncbi:MAG: hypothetical protein PUP93_26965 [Rhizonema sp. NSF051]|nr:hypothetical protein [Rhizonema sp. NSF051]